MWQSDYTAPETKMQGGFRVALAITKWICLTIIALAVLFCFMVIVIGGKDGEGK